MVLYHNDDTKTFDVGITVLLLLGFSCLWMKHVFLFTQSIISGKEVQTK
jgi:hypothetical protein